MPRYLPQHGMAPEWARANRPLVIIITGINIVVAIVFRADVEAQGGAYATGVLVLMSSAALAVAINAWRKVARWVPFFAIAAVFSREWRSAQNRANSDELFSLLPGR